jgi:Asp-tRNA(Asn)/Glu-tRNA(Gln) amidotransferase A subunit family amidase
VVWQLPAVELLAEYRAGRLSPVEVVQASASRIEELDGSIGAVVTASVERAHSEAILF